MTTIAQRRVAGATALMILLYLLQVALFAAPAQAANEFSADFAAAAPGSYDHSAGGGAWDDKTTNVDVVESLEGGDFACGETATYLQKLTVGAGVPGASTARLSYEFLAETTGQPGVAHIDVTLVQVNYGTIQDLLEDSVDSGISDDGGSTATVVSEVFSPSGTTPFNGADTLDLTITVDDLEANETVIVRIDVLLGCDPGSSPTGNLQAALVGKTITVGYTVGTFAGGGNQTVPFKQIGKISIPGVASVSVSGTCAYAQGVATFTYTVTASSGVTVDFGGGNQNLTDGQTYQSNSASASWTATAPDGSLFAGDLETVSGTATVTDCTPGVVSVSVSGTCAYAQGVATFTYTVTASSGVTVDFGGGNQNLTDGQTYQSNSASASWTATAPDGSLFAGDLETVSGTATVTDCTPGVASVSVSGTCAYAQGVATFTYTVTASSGVTVDFGGGNQNLTDGQTYQSNSASASWTATAPDGSLFAGDLETVSGTATVTDCTPGVASVSVSGTCAYAQGVATFTYTVTASSGVTVDFGGGNQNLTDGQTYQSNSASASWTATAPDGSLFAGDLETVSGTATVTDCTPPPPPPPPSTGTITVTKVAPEATASDEFVFFFNGDRFVLGAGESESFSGLNAGTFTVLEENNADWELTALSCVDASGGTATSIADGGASGTASVGLAQGENVTCTFTNEPAVEVAGTTITTVPEVSADTLPFTGSESGDMVKLAMLAMAAGALMLFAVRGPKEEEEIAAEIGGWSSL